jgi:hypothetical protein
MTLRTTTFVELAKIILLSGQQKVIDQTKESPFLQTSIPRDIVYWTFTILLHTK